MLKCVLGSQCKQANQELSLLYDISLYTAYNSVFCSCHLHGVWATCQ